MNERIVDRLIKEADKLIEKEDLNKEDIDKLCEIYQLLRLREITSRHSEDYIMLDPLMDVCGEENANND